MIAVLGPDCSLQQKAEIVRLVEGHGLRVQVSETGDASLVAVIGGGGEGIIDRLRSHPAVLELRTDAPPYTLVAREQRPEGSRIRFDGFSVGGEEIVVIAGPCAVESRDGILSAARAVVGGGARMLRGGAFKPRTSPYSFQGLGVEGLELLAEARDATGLKVVTEVVTPGEASIVAEHADVLQVGSRNMQNFRLLSAVGEQPRPVLLKRGLMATIEELLLAAEYVVTAGNPRVMLCERGIRTYETSTRNTLDIAAVPVLKERTHLPVIVDPSHAAGRRELVASLSRAAVAAGADGLIVEVHPRPDEALSDGRQSLDPAGFEELMDELRRTAAAVGRHVVPGEPVESRSEAPADRV
ncbi:MAG: 3-deoxy-7-phosphoheptulonate synthase [marine benthic group bacterium]|nr:3-deoxy-7-phosphoheptulonate synthase [Gemmatimonadota bacterium]